MRQPLQDTEDIAVTFAQVQESWTTFVPLSTSKRKVRRPSFVRSFVRRCFWCCWCWRVQCRRRAGIAAAAVLVAWSVASTRFAHGTNATNVRRLTYERRAYRCFRRTCGSGEWPTCTNGWQSSSCSSTKPSSARTKSTARRFVLFVPFGRSHTKHTRDTQPAGQAHAQWLSGHTLNSWC